MSKELIQLWNQNKIYKSDNYTFSIDSPPPSISGVPHMGTAFGYILKDIIARYNRIFGERVFYSLGFDDNGMPTEKLVEKKTKTLLRNLKKEEAEQICFDIINKEEKEFEAIFQDMGLSHDPDLKYQTIDKLSQKIAQDSFIDLYKKGLIYRSESPIIWDTKDQTALSQSDLMDLETIGEMHFIQFNNNVSIATSRPELIPAITSIFCHPDDPKYKTLHNTFVEIPILNISVPILTDDKVNIDKGTGLVMCCTFGDTTDIYWWKKYQLQTKSIFTHYGTISDNIYKFVSDKDLADSLYNQKIIDARKIMISKFSQYIYKSTKINHVIKIAERSQSPVEYIISPQWMLRITHLKDQLKEQADKINWYPKHSKNIIFQWIDGLSWDWCISRQRSFGVSIPVWYTKSNEIIVATETPVNTSKEYPNNSDSVIAHSAAGQNSDTTHKSEVSQNSEDGKTPEAAHKSEVFQNSEDGQNPEAAHKSNTIKHLEALLNNEVFDTWWTSSLTPQINQKKLFNTDIMSLRTQGHEIIRTWAFYTILKSYLHNDQIPWKNIFIHGWCLAEDKSKMSKSKGNTISPINIMQNYGADALRYWAASSSIGQDTCYSEATVKLGKKIANKLKNAAKFIKHFQFDNIFNEKNIIFEIDKWIITKVNKLKENISLYIKEFNYSKTREELDKFFLETFCDYYIEIVKTRAYNDDNIFNAEESLSAISTLYYTLYICLIAYGPIMPFMTDDIWLNILHNKESIHICNIWNKFHININYNNQDILYMFEIIEDIRKLKTLKQLSLNTMLNNIEIKYTLSANIIKELKTTLKVTNITIGEQNTINE